MRSLFQTEFDLVDVVLRLVIRSYLKYLNFFNFEKYLPKNGDALASRDPWEDNTYLQMQPSCR